MGNTEKGIESPASTALSRERLARAMTANPIWSRRLGWAEHLHAIAVLVDSTVAQAGAAELARAVAAWQAGAEQRSGARLSIDGIIGPETWEAMRAALAPEDSLTGVRPADAPAVPSGWEEVIATFGDPTPLLRDDGTISEENAARWERQTLAPGRLPFAVPLDAREPQGQKKTRFYAHRKLVRTFEAVFSEIARLGLQSEIRSWGGIYNFRPIRGSKRSLSLHAFGAAIDLNAESNQLGTDGDMSPAVVDVFGHFGFVWGGNFHRPDPMHFQYATGY